MDGSGFNDYFDYFVRIYSWGQLKREISISVEHKIQICNFLIVAYCKKIVKFVHSKNKMKNTESIPKTSFKGLIDL